MGRFCPECGQDNVRTRLDLRPVFLDAFQSFIGWESALARTLKGLARDPGGMVAEYVAGKRRRFVNPARFALLTLAAYILTARVLALDPIKLAGFEMSVSSDEEDTATRIKELLVKYFDVLLYATLPLRAMMLRICFRKSVRNLAEDMVLVLYLAGFAWILTIISAPFMALEWMWVLPIISVLKVVWFVRAVRNFYERSWFTATWRSLLILILHTALMVAIGIMTAALWERWIGS